MDYKKTKHFMFIKKNIFFILQNNFVEFGIK